MSKRAHEIEVIARGILVEGGAVLLCRDVKHGYRSLPGGHVDVGEAASEAVAREFVEETGQVVAAGPCVLIHEHRFTQKGTPRHEVNLVFLVERKGSGEVVSLEPRLAFDWVPVSDAAAIDLRPALVGEMLLSLLSSRIPTWRSTVSP